MNSRISRVESRAARNGRRRRIKQGVEFSKIDLFAAHLQLSNPPTRSIAPSHARDAAGVVLVEARPILDVEAMRDIAEVLPAVVGTASVSVVNLKHGPLACHVEHSEALCGVETPIKPDQKIAAAFASWIGPGPMAPVAASCDATSEHACQRVVMKQFAQARGGKIGRSHDAVPRRVVRDRAARPTPTQPRHYAEGAC